MLCELEIRNFAVIEAARLEFGAGLNILSGETGSGKSLIVDAIEAALGGRVSSELVRSGAEKAWVTAVFSELPVQTAELLLALGLEPEADGVLVVNREIEARGRSLGRLNGRVVPLSSLREVTASLVDLYGQHEHQSLLRADRQLELLDAFAAEAVAAREAVAVLNRRLREIRAALGGLADEREAARREEIWSYQLEEIGRADPRPGEDLELEDRREILLHREKLLVLGQRAYDLLYGGNGAALDGMGVALKALEEAAGLDPHLQVPARDLRGCLEEAKEVARDLSRYLETVEADPGELERVEERLEGLRELKRKYGAGLAEVLAYREKTAADLACLREKQEQAGEWREEERRVENALMKAAAELSARRRQAAGELSVAVEAELESLGMGQAIFRVEVSAGATERTDRVEFLLGANVGETARPLAKVASGGELSRVMLAIRTVCSRPAAPAGLPTLVFDEVDAGLGGKAASKLADKLKGAAASVQVLAVTHLPQVAVAGERHFLLEKGTEDGRTVAGVKLLQGEERALEIARMLAGETGAKALDHARELLDRGMAG